MKVLSRGFIILLFGCLLVGAAAVLEVTLRQTSNSALLSNNPTERVHSLPLEQGVFKNNELALAYGLVQVDSSNAKDLNEYYANRAYHGAPPVIPHPINTQGTIGAQGCSQCHQKGGYVSKFKAFAPVTPHPQLVSCLQCHVQINEETLFRESNFLGKEEPRLHQKALSTSPPIIPHKIHMHENCLSCHGGPSAPLKLRTTHPDRSNCLQCHAKGEKAADFGEWKRKKKE